ncbi:MAG: tetratricopeptide repeat protein [Paracoccus sp. (in: a-proteobacteria)]
MKLPHSLVFACLLALPAPGPAASQDAAPPPSRSGDVAAPDAGADDKPTAPLTQDLAGPYLAARTAAMENDFAAAADYYLRAREQDPDSAYISDSAMISLLASGQIDRAAELIDKAQAARHSRLVGLVEYARAAQAQDWTGLLAQLDKTKASAGDEGSEQLLDQMLRAWALLGTGNASDADAVFKEVRKIAGTAALVDYHTALAKALVGDFESAATLLHSDNPEQDVMGAIAEAQVLAQLDRRDDAIALLEQIEGIGIDGIIEEMLAKLKSGEPVPFDLVNDPRDGIAQVFLTFATLLSNDVDPNPLALIHARLAAYIAPDMTDARLMVAQMLQTIGQFDAAEVEFDILRERGQMRPVAELVRIDALAQAGRMEDAEKAARALTETHPELTQSWVALGDLLRQQDEWAEAATAYDKALALTDPANGEERWFPLYARAIAEERLGQFDKAEADLKEALKARPDNAQMLNYLGYSSVDRGQNLDEALDLIQRAVELSPDDGYILDSLGWAYYRLGRYRDAVDPQERAVAQMVNDSLVNDHLGDIYWMVGRKREAEIQWKRALSFGPETEGDAWRIRQKLDHGLDWVLAEEKANGGTLPPPPEDAAAGDAPVAD